MPKIPDKKSDEKRVPIRKVADQLLRMQAILDEVRRGLDDLWVTIYTTGLTDRGPIREDRDDIPF